MLDELKKAHEVLRKGGVILTATDTCWGLCCDAASEQALKRVSEITGSTGPFVVIIPTSDWLSTYVVKVPDIAWDIVDFTEKPLTVVYNKGKNVAPAVLGKDGSIALRVTADKFLKDLLGKYQKPLIATLPGEGMRVYSAIPESILSAVDYVVPFRKEEKVSDPPSTMMTLGEHGEIKFLRKS